MLAEDDSVLVRAAQQGDTATFALLLVRHRPVALALCWQLLGDPALAEDAVQEACLHALLSLDCLRQPARFGSWLAGIGLNVCRMSLRSRSRECQTWDALDGTHDHGTRAVAAADRRAADMLYLVANQDRLSDPAERVAAADLAASVQAAVAALPRGQRAAVSLFYLSELSYKETAARLGIAEGAVRMRLCKARGTLRGTLRAIAEEENVVMAEKQVQDTSPADTGPTQGSGDANAAEEERRGSPEGTVCECSFCGKSQQLVNWLIAGPGGVYICSECVALCNEILAYEEAKTAAGPE